MSNIIIKLFLFYQCYCEHLASHGTTFISYCFHYPEDFLTSLYQSGLLYHSNEFLPVTIAHTNIFPEIHYNGTFKNCFFGCSLVCTIFRI